MSVLLVRKVIFEISVRADLDSRRLENAGTKIRCRGPSLRTLAGSSRACTAVTDACIGKQKTEDCKSNLQVCSLYQTRRIYCTLV